MVQEVFMPNGHRIFYTENEKCMYSEEVAKSMNEAGYKVTMDKKKWPKTETPKKKIPDD